MNLDVNTLFLVTIYVEAILGLLLLFAWIQNGQIPALAWWGSAHLLRAVSVVLFGMYGTVPEVIAIDVANVTLFLAYGIMWTGARSFDGLAPRPMSLVAGPALWLVAGHLPSVLDGLDIRSLLGAGIVTSYMWLSAYELWRSRREHLLSRWPAIFMMFAHGALFLLRTPLSAMLPWSPTSQVFDSVWLTVLSFEALLFTIAIAFILLAMATERTENRHRTAAMIDPLTGIPNRRAFLELASAQARRQSRRANSTAVLLIDLDRFKSINDRFGHAIGDRVLQTFAESATAVLRPTDPLGRLGGEEFGVVLFDVTREKAVALAERLRCVFAETTDEVDGHQVAATLSIGLSFNGEGRIEVQELLAQADHALYYAKERGRDRVEIAPHGHAARDAA